MAIVRPSYASIFASLYTDLSTGLGAVPIAAYSILGSLSRAFARALNSAYSYVDSAFLNAVPWTATGTNADAWAALWGVARKRPASATGQATFGTNGAAFIPSGTSFVGSNTVLYTSTADVVASGAGDWTVDLVTSTFGAVTNMAAGASINLTSTTIANVVPNGTVVLMAGGTDAETDANLFARAQEARSNPRQGGASGDYIFWAEQAAAVTRCWVDATPAQPGNVVVYVMLDDNGVGGFPVGTDGTATQDTRGPAATGNQLQIANFIYGQYRRPVTAYVTVVSPIAQPVNITITNANPSASTGSLVDVEIKAALTARLLLIGSPLGQTIYESDLTQAIQTVLTSYNMTVPNASIVVPVGYLPVLGTVTYL